MAVTGISPMRLGDVVGRVASRAFEADELIQPLTTRYRSRHGESRRLWASVPAAAHASSTYLRFDLHLIVTGATCPRNTV